MKYTVANTSAIGKYYRVFDALGMELKYVTFCDTETGEVEQLVWNPATRFFDINETNQEIARSKTIYRFPLRVKLIKAE